MPENDKADFTWKSTRISSCIAKTSTKYFANQNKINRKFVDKNILGLGQSFRKSSLRFSISLN
jgi:hypothetical protein